MTEAAGKPQYRGPLAEIFFEPPTIARGNRAPPNSPRANMELTSRPESVTKLPGATDRSVALIHDYGGEVQRFVRTRLLTDQSAIPISS